MFLGMMRAMCCGLRIFVLHFDTLFSRSVGGEAQCVVCAVGYQICCTLRLGLFCLPKYVALSDHTHYYSMFLFRLGSRFIIS